MLREATGSLPLCLRGETGSIPVRSATCPNVPRLAMWIPNPRGRVRFPGGMLRSQGLVAGGHCCADLSPPSLGDRANEPLSALSPERSTGGEGCRYDAMARLAERSQVLETTRATPFYDGHRMVHVEQIQQTSSTEMGSAASTTFEAIAFAECTDSVVSFLDQFLRELRLCSHFPFGHTSVRAERLATPADFVGTVPAQRSSVRAGRQLAGKNEAAFFATRGTHSSAFPTVISTAKHRVQRSLQNSGRSGSIPPRRATGT
jgi:hypothetical protein